MPSRSNQTGMSITAVCRSAKKVFWLVTTCNKQEQQIGKKQVQPTTVDPLMYYSSLQSAYQKDQDNDVPQEQNQQHNLKTSSRRLKENPKGIKEDGSGNRVRSFRMGKTVSPKLASSKLPSKSTARSIPQNVSTFRQRSLNYCRGYLPKVGRTSAATFWVGANPADGPLAASAPSLGSCLLPNPW